MIALPLSLFISLVASWFILTPIFDGVSNSEIDTNSELEFEKERLFLKLEELEQEKILNRLTEQTYLSSKQEVFAELSECLEKIKRSK